MEFLGTMCIALLFLHGVTGSYLPCGRNERYNECGTACPLTCENYDKPPEPCPRICQRGCECVEGFVRRDDGKCVRPAQCPNKLERTESSTKCEKRYFKHYEAKGCTPEFEEGNDCPKKFNCPKELEINDNACHYHDRLYQIGESVDTGNPCEKCTCRRGSEGLEIGCDPVQCPIEPPVNDTCREVFEPGKCCAVRVECEKTCELGGKIYKLGEKMSPEEDPCIICTCTEDWMGISEDSCTFHNCVLENERKKLAEGCLPIYQEDTCCPKEFLCEFPEEGLLYRSAATPGGQDQASGSFCEFKGNRYKVGDILDYQHPPDAYTCTCLIPPDFTCVKKKCPGPPKGDYENCRPIYLSGGVCPIYHCKLQYDSDEPMLRDNGCPDDYLCQKSCRNRGYKSGKCRGNTCECH